MPTIYAPMADKMLTAVQRAEYLDGLANPDVRLDEAAHAIGITATKLKALRKRDQVFDAECIEALAERDYRETAEVLAAKRKRIQEGSDRLIEVDLATKVPGYEHLRRDRMKIDAQVTGLVIELDGGTFQQWLDALPLEKKKLFREMLLEMGGKVIESEHPVIDQP